MTAENLQPGDLFKLEGQRKFRKVGHRGPILLTGEPHDGKLLIVMDDCGQYILEKNRIVITPKPAAGGEGQNNQQNGSN